MLASAARSSGLLVAVEDLRVVYPSRTGEVIALDGVNLRVQPGDFVCVTGPSGSGKSTLLHAICGLRPAQDGTVQLGETQIASLSERELAAFRLRHVGLVFQFFHLVRSLTIRQNVALPLLMSGATMREVRDEVDELLRAVGMADRATSSLSKLSGGELQRIAIARALASAPALVLADEPTGNLDARTGDSVMALLETICRAYQATVIVVTHDPAAAAYADRRFVLEDGRLSPANSATEPRT